MKILMVTSEAVPFSKSGGLADVATSLSVALASLGNDVRLILPNYYSTDDSEFTLSPYRIGIPSVEIREREFNNVTVYLVDHPLYTTRKGIYGENNNHPYADNLRRYTLLSKVALELCKEIDWIADILHGHDWTAGFLAHLAQSDPSKRFKHSKTVFTIHNLAYQGEFPRIDFLLADVPYKEAFFSKTGVKKKVNMLKSGIETYDMITTVSPTYAQEIQSEEHGCNLDLILRRRSSDIVGILNGIDTQEWDPQNDPLLPFSYSADNLEGKWRIKKALQKRFNLAVEPDTLLIGMISRIVEQKGFVELLQGSPSPLEQILSDYPIQIVIVGTGESSLEKKLVTLAELFDNLSVNLIFSNEAAHLVEAGSDFFLMPSRYEPCGLNQMYSLRYGTIPIARRTGGLSDSIVDIGSEEGTGILFDEMSGSKIYEAIGRAVELYARGAEPITSIRKRGMRVDFSWLNSAQLYMEVYKQKDRR